MAQTCIENLNNMFKYSALSKNYTGRFKRMAYIMIAPVGDDIDALFVGIRDFPTKQVILLAPPKKLDAAIKAKKDLERFKIGVTIEKIEGNIWEDMFAKISKIAKLFNNKEIIINTATGDKMTTCAATSAAFVNGLRAFSVQGNESMLLPILKFSYYKLISDKKMKILNVLAKDKTCCRSLDELAKRVRMSLPLMSYHINGNLKSEGLIELGLVEISEQGGRTAISLSMLGDLLLKGYV
ncbi:hypothetical protein COV18_05530 [Candidatus Woesearchaeota archaeon CG10_big_fil_rev_8_21_14_0_10_37_12]|nr:MAG: hypothetical protein COV18_05530 [Candidatus Woesearchaeota archaeon CG10_big_fil_rev_8_21_14_0_10_37_12]